MRQTLLAITFLGLAACTDAGVRSSITPETPVVVGEGQTQAVYGQVTTGAPGLSTSTQPAAFEMLSTSSSCRTPKASSNARAAYVYTYGGGNSVPIHHVNFIDTPEAAAERDRKIREAKRNPANQPKGFTQKALKKSATSFAAGNAVEWSRQVDVLVTETEAPVFLYLSSYDSVLWNIQRAPGVEIDGIVVNSYDAGVIANGVAPDRTGFISFANSPTQKCYVSGQGRAIPAEERVASAKKMTPSIDLSSYKPQWEQEYRDNMKFFRTEVRSLIGKRPEWILNDARGGSFEAVLVGPVPAAPFEAQPVSKIQIPSHITPYWGTRKGAFKYFGLDAAT